MMRASKWVVALAVFVGGAAGAAAQDWPQWRGENRDGRATHFTAPATWPKELTKKWSVSIGNGVATPALVGDRLYVFSRQDGNEVVRCLRASDGTEIWKDAYPSEGTTGGASGFPGPRSSPTVEDGKVVTLGVRGILSCYDAQSGQLLWRKEDTGGWPQFYTASSPIVVNGLCIAQLGGEETGAIVAYDLATGEEKWRAKDMPPSYASPMRIDFGSMTAVVAAIENHMVAVDAADGTSLWKIQFTQGRYNSATPIVDGQTLIMAGPGSGISAISLEPNGSELREELLWNNPDNSVQFNSPVLKDGKLFGLSNNGTLFCIDTATHATGWAAPLGGPEPPSPFGPGPFGPGRRARGEGRRGDGPSGEGQRDDQASQGSSPGAPARLVATTGQALAQASETPAPVEPPAAAQDQQRQERRERRGRGRGRGGRGRGGYGSIVDAGDVLMVLSPSMELVVYEPSATEFRELARYKVADTATYAYPVASGNRIFVKDQDAVTLWVVE